MAQMSQKRISFGACHACIYEVACDLSFSSWIFLKGKCNTRCLYHLHLCQLCHLVQPSNITREATENRQRWCWTELDWAADLGMLILTISLDPSHQLPSILVSHRMIYHSTIAGSLLCTAVVTFESSKALLLPREMSWTNFKKNTFCRFKFATFSQKLQTKPNCATNSLHLPFCCEMGWDRICYDYLISRIQQWTSTGCSDTTFQ